LERERDKLAAQIWPNKTGERLAVAVLTRRGDIVKLRSCLMPETNVYFFRDRDGSVPVLEWLLELRVKNLRAFKKCFSLIELLEEFGHELRRPRADLLRDGVYELRTQAGHVNYRILYGFVGKDVALLVNALTKARIVPAAEIERAVERLRNYKRDPAAHRFISEGQSNG
jgi:hypothetical protein